jgi:hypothetical protein
LSLRRELDLGIVDVLWGGCCCCDSVEEEEEGETISSPGEIKTAGDEGEGEKDFEAVDGEVLEDSFAHLIVFIAPVSVILFKFHGGGAMKWISVKSFI